MAFEVTMPQMGADMTEGTLVKWFKDVGESVNRGEVIAEIETDKANVEIEAFESGTLLKQIAEPGDVIPVGEVIAILGAEGEETREVDRKTGPVEPAKREIEPEVKAASSAPAAAPAATTVVAAPETPRPPADGRIRISPVARKIAEEAGLEFSTLQGTGPDGRIVRKDVEAAIAAGNRAGGEARQQQKASALAQPPQQRPPAPAPEGLSRMRQAIARRMAQSKSTAPHYYLTLDIDMTAALEFRRQFNEIADETQRASINDLIVKACAIALQRMPAFNAEFHDTGLVYHDEINVCIGVALDDGLIAPAIMDCQAKSLGVIAADAKDVIGRARDGRLRADEYSAGTFTITNLGAYGVETLIGIINPPQAAILGVGSVMPQPVVKDNQVVIRQVMKVALSADHRVTDGAQGARFIKEIQNLLENPASLAL